MLTIKTVNLETVVGVTTKKLPYHTWPEFAFAGKSNVGKSTLINALMNRKSYARVSEKPGKTQTINYYCINDKVSDEEKELAEEFLVWLNTSEAGQKFVVEEMSFIPYNADPATTSAGYSLGDSIISYMAADKTLTNAYAGAPKGWATDNFGLQMMENYVNTAEWSDTAYSDIADYAINSWAEMAGLE